VIVRGGGSIAQKAFDGIEEKLHLRRRAVAVVEVRSFNRPFAQNSPRGSIHSLTVFEREVTREGRPLIQYVIAFRAMHESDEVGFRHLQGPGQNYAGGEYAVIERVDFAAEVFGQKAGIFGDLFAALIPEVFEKRGSVSLDEGHEFFRRGESDLREEAMRINIMMFSRS
jgi:hypothetical protein